MAVEPLFVEIETSCAACRKPLYLTYHWHPTTRFPVVTSECANCDLPTSWTLAQVTQTALAAIAAREAPAAILERLTDDALMAAVQAFLGGRRPLVADLVGPAPPDESALNAAMTDYANRRRHLALTAMRGELVAALTGAMSDH